MAAVRFRGLDSRTGLARWGLAAVAIGIVAGATAPAAARDLAAVVDANPDALVWLFERLFAWLAYIAVAGSVIYGLLLSTKLLDAIAHRPISFTLHQDLAALGLGLAGIHAMLLGLDHSVPFSIAQILVPGLAPHAPVAVAFGQVALYLMAAVTASFYLRKRIGQRAWRMFHYVTFLAFAGTTIHGIASGSDSSAPWAEAIYIVSAALVLFLLTYRIGVSLASRVAARVAARAASRGLADGAAYPRGGGRVDAFPGAAQRAAAIADTRAGGSYQPVSEDAPGARPLGGPRSTSARDGAPKRRTAAG
jgi:sulfoxide reductase heme-binding subunit YedZ